MIRSIQEGDPLKHVGSLIRFSKLKESAKSCMFLSSGVMLKSPNINIFSYVSKYVERFFDKLSKNAVLLWSGGLYTPTISHFRNRIFISRKIDSVSSLCVLQECCP